MNFINKKNRNFSGFTLLEIMVGVSLFTIVVVLTGSAYLFSQKAYRNGADKGELTQNARVSLDRMSREIRQSTNIASDLPPVEDDPLNPPLEEIFFENGHNAIKTTYIYYYLDQGDLKRSQKAYYFSDEPGIFVSWNSVDEYGDPPEELILDDVIVGEYFNYLGFWGEDGLVKIHFKLKKNAVELEMNSSIFARN